MAKSWEITKVWIKVDSRMNVEPSSDSTKYHPVSAIWISSNGKEEGWEEASVLASQGWELVGSVPIIAGHEKIGGNFGAGSSYTQGYWLIFKREKES